MTRFIVTMTADARVSCSVLCEAKDRDEAAEIAFQEASKGKVTWNYDGVDDDTIEVEEINT
jgi:hypothetical protein